MDFWKVMNVKKKTYVSQQTYLYIWVSDILFEVLLCIYCKGLFCLEKTVIMHTFLCICIKQSQHKGMRKNNSKLNFAKNHWVGWFSCGQLKISKYSISLAQLDKCPKSKFMLLSSIWFVATIKIIFWTWIWSMRHCGLGQKVGCWLQCWINSLMWKSMGLVLEEKLV